MDDPEMGSVSQRSGDFQSKDNTIRNSFDVIKKGKRFAEDDMKEKKPKEETGRFNNLSALAPQDDKKRTDQVTRLDNPSTMLNRESSKVELENQQH